MNYPVEILPKKGLKCIADFQEGKLIRHTSSRDIWEDDGLIRDVALCTPKTNMMDLSTSLLGVFGDPHFKLNILDRDLHSFCAPDFESQRPVFEEQFVIDEERDYFIIEIMSIDGISVEINLEKEVIQAICKVRHTPAKWNYFHFSINWYLPKMDKYWHELDDSDRKKKWSKERLSSRTRSELKMKVRNVRIEDCN